MRESPTDIEVVAVNVVVSDEVCGVNVNFSRCD
jgi:hypothetical protein